MYSLRPAAVAGRITQTLMLMNPLPAFFSFYIHSVYVILRRKGLIYRKNALVFIRFPLFILKWPLVSCKVDFLSNYSFSEMFRGRLTGGLSQKPEKLKVLHVMWAFLNILVDLLTAVVLMVQFFLRFSFPPIPFPFFKNLSLHTTCKW